MSTTPFADATPPLAPNPGASQPGIAPSANPRTPWKRIRIGFLVLVHLALFTHIYLYYGLDKRAVGSIDFQEFFRTFLKEGAFNTGALFALIIFVATLLFGRAFCGWACHFGAFQELCHSILKRTPLKGVTTHSTWLKIVPIFALAYFILWPNLRPVFERGVPPVSIQMSRTAIWDVLPGPVVAAGMFLFDGLIVVMFFGTRAFCRFVCPWGAMFKPLNWLSPAAITKVGECAECRTCVGACQMGIDVQNYVKVEGRVAASDCIKCLSCVEACPHETLALRWDGRNIFSNFFTRSSAEDRLTFSESLVVVAFSLIGLFSIMHLATLSPLLAVVLGAISGFSLVLLYRATKNRAAGRWGAALRTEGGWTGVGMGLAAFTAILLMAFSLGGTYKIATGMATRYIEQNRQAEAIRPLAIASFLAPTNAHLKLAVATALFETGDRRGAIGKAREAAAVAPEDVTTRQILGDYLLAEKEVDSALKEYEAAVALAPRDGKARMELCRLYQKLDRRADAERCAREGVQAGVFKTDGRASTGAGGDNP